LSETFCPADDIVSSLFVTTFYTIHALHAARSSHEKAVRLFVRPSVCLSVKRVDRYKTEESSAQIFRPYERPFILVFLRRRIIDEVRRLLPDILGQTDPVGAKTPIFNVHRVRKKGDTLFLPVTLRNANRSSKFFYLRPSGNIT